MSTNSYRLSQMIGLLQNLDQRENDDDAQGLAENTIQDRFMPIEETLKASDTLTVTPYTPANFVWGGNQSLLSPTFVRASTAYLPQTGQSVLSGEPRYGFGNYAKFGQSLLIEEGTTNVVRYSEQFTQAAWSQLGTPTITPNSAVSPNGLTTASAIVDTDTVSFQGIRQDSAIASDSTSHTFSLYIRQDTDQTRFPIMWAVLTGGTTPISAGVRLNTATGAYSDISGTASVAVTAASGYWRMLVTVANNSTGNTTARMDFYPAHAKSLSGSSDQSTTGSCVIWGAQVENKTNGTTYMQTTSLPATRSAESVKYTVQPQAPGPITILGRWIPSLPSSAYPYGNPYPRLLTVVNPSAAQRTDYTIWTGGAGGNVVFEKNIYDQPTQALTPTVTGLTWNAGDVISFALRDDGTGLKGFIKINSAATTTGAATNGLTGVYPSGLTAVYPGSTNGASQANGYYDTIQIEQGSWTDAQIEAWFTSPSPPVATGNTLLLAQMDGNLASDSVWLDAGWDWNGGGRWSA